MQRRNKSSIKNHRPSLRGKSQDSTDSNKDFRDQYQERTSSESVSVNTSQIPLAYFMFPLLKLGALLASLETAAKTDRQLI